MIIEEVFSFTTIGDNMSSVIIIRLDEWMHKIEVTQEGTFLYIDKDVKNEVLEEMVKVLGDSDG